MPMTRAEGICACTNIIELVEDLSEKLPENYATSISDKATSIRKTLRERAQFSHLTDKQDNALRNMWGGLRRWDHQDEGNDDLFWGLSDVIMDLADVAESEAEPAKAALSMDEGLDLPEVSDEAEARFAQRQAAYEQRQQREAPAEPSTPAAAPRKQAVQRVGLVQEDIVRERENQVTEALQRFHADGIRVVEKKVAQHGDLQAILKMTTSDRTQQLIRAAYHAGAVRGAHNLADALIKRAQ
jgi:hypothetical protein